jgi:hypothetical protein
MARTQGYYDLRDAFRQEGCPVCRLTLAGVARYIGAVDYESVADPGVRERLRASLGFCNAHAHQWLGAAHVLGTAQLYADLLARLAEELRALPFRRRGRLASVASRLTSRAEPVDGGDEACAVATPTARCPLCVVRAEAEDATVATLLGGLAEPAFAAAYAASAGLCLPHLCLALGRAPDAGAFDTLREAAIAGEERLLGQLREVVRKHDYRFRAEGWAGEEDAPERAVERAVGRPAPEPEPPAGR